MKHFISAGAARKRSKSFAVAAPAAPVELIPRLARRQRAMAAPSATSLVDASLFQILPLWPIVDVGFPVRDDKLEKLIE